MSMPYYYIDLYSTFSYHNSIVQLKEIRIKACLSQEDLGKLAGISAATVNRLERNKQKPNFVTIRKLAKALGVEPGDIQF